MDQYTSSDLLCKWGFVEYVNIFADARIDITTLQLVGDREITSHIGPVGDRLRFKSNLEIWKKELSTADLTVVSSPLPDLNASFLQDLNPHSPKVPVPTEPQWQHDTGAGRYSNNEIVHNNSVLEILERHVEGRAILIKENNNNGLLNYDLRTKNH